MKNLAMIDVLKILIILVCAWKSSSYFKNLIAERRLILGLAVGDLKLKYAGSALGNFWAFAQPTLTTLVYWFVFQLGFKSRPVGDFPFILWLVSGLIPWFFLGETVVAGAGVIAEYVYLVKKVMFKVDILPAVKVFAFYFVHLIFMAFVLFLYVLYGVELSLYAIQLVYYSIALLIFALGAVYLFAALQVFLKDVIQVVSVVMQLVFWSVPIVWDIAAMPEQLHGILKANPLYYIVEGYRDSLINHVWFWEKQPQTLSYWCIVLLLFLLGVTVFQRLRPHFADVL